MNERDKFEEFCLSKNMSIDEIALLGSDYREYAERETQIAWESWQACAEQYEARLKVAEDAISGAICCQSLTGDFEMYSATLDEALNKIRGEV